MRILSAIFLISNLAACGVEVTPPVTPTPAVPAEAPAAPPAEAPPADKPAEKAPEAPATAAAPAPEPAPAEAAPAPEAKVPVVRTDVYTQRHENLFYFPRDSDDFCNFIVTTGLANPATYTPGMCGLDWIHYRQGPTVDFPAIDIDYQAEFTYTDDVLTGLTCGVNFGEGWMMGAINLELGLCRVDLADWYPHHTPATLREDGAEVLGDFQVVGFRAGRFALLNAALNQGLQFDWEPQPQP